MQGQTHDSYLETQTQALKDAGLWRTLQPLAGACGPTVRIGEEELLLFCSNNYLGLAADPRLTEAAAAAARALGAGSGASRLVCGSLALHGELEARLAQLKGKQDCVLFSSGYLANLGTIAALCGRGDTVISDQLNHASIIDGCRLSGADIAVYPHGDAAACAALLDRARGRVLIVSDGVFSMDGDLAPLAALAAAAERRQAWLMVDEAHATGVIGEGGAGAAAALGVSGRVAVVMGTLSKALGSAGGFVAGSRLLCDYLRNRARSFVYDTAPTPAAVAAALAALTVVADEPTRRHQVLAAAQHLGRELAALGYAVPPPAAAIVPVLIGDSAVAMRLSAYLRRAGVLALAIRPPTVPAGTARLRLCPMATHSAEQLAQVIAAFRAAREALPELRPLLR
jgi:8-amino-7-oxononanoate synthase